MGVHIADVAEYVRANSPLDREALHRGNSVYLLSEVLPMLPKALSNGICSLNEGVDRLCLSVIFELDDKGKVYNYHIAETVINSDRRLIYSNVSDFLEDGKVHESLEDLTEELTILNTIAKNRKKMRDKRGNIDFSFEEPAIELDADGHPTHIGLVDHRDANDLIEEFMLLANETVSGPTTKRNCPSFTASTKSRMLKSSPC